uniref:Glyco_hydr_116N domain-containing protein n=1 Tax=Macrostomum lignano TaxID=282301 RepID=A0A1I8JHT5_9PLAT
GKDSPNGIINNSLLVLENRQLPRPSLPLRVIHCSSPGRLPNRLLAMRSRCHLGQCRDCGSWICTSISIVGTGAAAVFFRPLPPVPEPWLRMLACELRRLPGVLPPPPLPLKFNPTPLLLEARRDPALLPLPPLPFRRPCTALFGRYGAPMPTPFLPNAPAPPLGAIRCDVVWAQRRPLRLVVRFRRIRWLIRCLKSYYHQLCFEAAARALFDELKCHGDWRPPAHGWLATFSREFEPCVPFHRPRWHQLLDLLGPSLRYLFRFYLRKRFIEKKRPFIDGLVHVPHEPVYGVPLGGLGCGSIGRGFRGEFRRFQLVPGLYEYAQPEADCFIVNLRRRGGTVFQRALDSCLPVALFEWRVENPTDEELEVSLTFCFKNGNGTSADAAGGASVEPFASTGDDDGQPDAVGGLIHQQINGMACTYGVAAMSGDNSSVTIWPRFDPSTNPSLANRLWSSLINTGRLVKWPPTAASSESEAKLFAGTATKSGEEVATAVCVSSRVPARYSVDSAKFCLAWHLPNVRFRSGEQLYTRRHTRWFNGSQSEATIALIRYSFNRLPNWLESISNWHNSVLNDSRLPDWFKSAVFNESYYLSDSGSIWLDGGDTNDWHSQDGRWRCPMLSVMTQNKEMTHISPNGQMYSCRHATWAAQLGRAAAGLRWAAAQLIRAVTHRRGELFLKRLLPLSDVIAFAFAAYQLFYELQLFGHLG